MLKYLPFLFGIAVALVMSPALAAQTQLVNHNDSVMRMQIGNALDGVSTVKIYYHEPSEKMGQLVKRGDLFFVGSIRWDTRAVIGDARIYKWGCEPLEYQVKGILSGQRDEIGALELEGWAPTFDHGCRLEEYVWNHNSKLTFKQPYAGPELPSRDFGGFRHETTFACHLVREHPEEQIIRRTRVSALFDRRGQFVNVDVEHLLKGKSVYRSDQYDSIRSKESSGEDETTYTWKGRYKKDHDMTMQGKLAIDGEGGTATYSEL